MLHPDTEIRNIDDSIGYGVFVTKPIPQGAITWVLDSLDQILDPGRASRLGPGYQQIVEKYTWRNARGQRILCWDFARYMNHSCEANTFSPGLNFEIAVRPIEAGEQLTSDYGALNLERPFACQCGSACCRGIIRPDDFETFAPHWDTLIQGAFRSIAEVPQPLWDLVTEKKVVEAALADRQSIPSILDHRFRPEVRSLGAQRRLRGAR